MNILVCILLIPLITCAAERTINVKREIDHGNNLALLNNINLQGKPTVNVNAIQQQPSNIVNIGTPDGTIPVNINTNNLAMGNPNALPNNLQYGYAPSYPPAAPPLDNNLVYFTNVFNPNIPLIPGASLQNGADNRNVVQSYAPQNVVEISQPYPVQLIREVKVPYPVHITRTVQVPVEVRVPVEVPKPYAVKVPHPVPVPVHIKVPVQVDRPYAVQITKTVAVPVEKPVYIKVPTPVQVPVAQPYPVAVPQPYEVRVPFVVRLPEGQAATNFGGAPLLGAGAVSSRPNVEPALLLSRFSGAVPEFNNQVTQPTPVPPLQPTTVCIACKSQVNESTVLITSPKPSLPPVNGNGLIPPDPPANLNLKRTTDDGLLNSYVSSKEGGVYRRGTEYQTNEYKKTW